MAGLIQNVKLFGEDIPWFQGLRDKGLEAFRRQGVPTAKTEAWKYTKPRDLNADDFVMNESNFLAELSETALPVLTPNAGKIIIAMGTTVTAGAAKTARPAVIVMKKVAVAARK